MIPDDLKTITTWGERLTREASRLATRKLPEFAWARSLQTLSRRVVDRPGPSPERFRRREALPAPPPAKPSDFEALGEPEELPSDGVPISARVRDRLRDLAGLRDEPMRLHRDAQGDRIAQAHHADAVTLGPDVFVRRGRARPDEPSGLALLAHEATHIVEAMRPGASWRRATGAGLDEEEREARRREQVALAPRAGLAGPSTASVASPPPPPAAPRVATPRVAMDRPAARPMAAEIDRPMPAQGPPPAALDIDALRRTLYRDIQDRIRSDYERGG